MFLIFIQEKSLYKNCFPLLGTESSKLCFTEYLQTRNYYRNVFLD